MGYDIQWHWAKRSTSSLNSLADLIAGLSRREILQMRPDLPLPGNEDIAKRAADALSNVCFVDPVDGGQIDIHALNPMELSDGGSPPASDQ
jgi:hypothetical protein